MFNNNLNSRLCKAELSVHHRNCFFVQLYYLLCTNNANISKSFDHPLVWGIRCSLVTPLWLEELVAWKGDACGDYNELELIALATSLVQRAVSRGFVCRSLCDDALAIIQRSVKAGRLKSFNRLGSRANCMLNVSWMLNALWCGFQSRMIFNCVNVCCEFRRCFIEYLKILIKIQQFRLKFKKTSIT